MVGAFEHDRSVYGVRDLAGGCADWMGEATRDGPAPKGLFRGGYWGGLDTVFCRLASRKRIRHDTHANIGARLARPLQEPR